MGTNQQPTDAQFIESLLGGDEIAFEELVSIYHSMMLRVAMIYVPDRRAAEDVIQETWIGVIRGLPKFEGRSSLKTWIFSILINRSRSYARKEDRFVHFTSSDTGSEVSVPADRFNPPDSPRADHWVTNPTSWDALPEAQLISNETIDIIKQAISALPHTQQEVITLRDIEQWTSEEVCNALSITDTNQRVLLHRARSKVRQTLEDYFKG